MEPNLTGNPMLRGFPSPRGITTTPEGSLGPVMDGQVVPASPALSRVLMRALVVPVLVLLAVTGYLVTATALAASTAPDPSDSSPPPVTSPWKAGYSRQYPGCVASVLWPERETPVAIVVRHRPGEIEKVAMRHATPRLFTEVRRGTTEVIGACYRS